MAGVEKELIRLNKLIASSGKYSRREADRLIFEGKVSVNGRVVYNPAERFSVQDRINVNGELLELSKKIYLKFYKPRGMLTSYDSFRGKKSLLDIPFFRKNKLGYSGRLDYDSEGLIIFTNDGELIYNLQRPEKKVEKEYIVHVNKKLKHKEEKMIINGLETEDIKYLPCKLWYEGGNKYRVILVEGKKRQIRKMFGHFKINVERLIRIRIGNITVKDLKVGEYRELTKAELEGLLKCIG
ncbi:rRNA pseudouridine synthase [Deferribacter autotrophicus]|uniref:Pseudouridine synthase n=1 Tax=Deferribacter autotrophicus TaxID=500465 RepID=A0A5A8F606_9BACT|nr:pseudouridine synthase [Deferribacter autotrophicus]KAA0259175.1 rRNA pseudouridine synthase [Deferribacter autotrophicus]